MSFYEEIVMPSREIKEEEIMKFRNETKPELKSILNEDAINAIGDIVDGLNYETIYPKLKNIKVSNIKNDRLNILDQDKLDEKK